MQAPAEFSVTTEMKKNLRNVLIKQNPIFSFAEQPALASLIACLGLQFELGRSAWDRLSFPLGIELKDYVGNPWQSKIISYQDQLGIRFWIPKRIEFFPRHPDFAEILHPLSIDEKGKLSQIVIFPNQVAQKYKKRGLDLVIVKEWVLSSFLANDGVSQAVNYFHVNAHEIASNSARFQSEFLAKNQIAFSGTHDVADHLLGGSAEGFVDNFEFYQRTKIIYDHIFSENKTEKSTLIVSYIMGVLLDDLAQPQWYGSKNHLEFAQKTLLWLQCASTQSPQVKSLALPQSFDLFMDALRRSDCIENLRRYFTDMQWQLSLL